VRAPSGDSHERIEHANARPRGRNRRQLPIAMQIVDAVFGPVTSVLNQREFATGLRVKRVGDAETLRRLLRIIRCRRPS
jgi:hypothetical protein